MKPVLFRKKHDAAAAAGLPNNAKGSMKALAWLLVNAAAAEWWSFVNDNALRVTDELIVGAVLTDRPGGLAWNDGWPAVYWALVVVSLALIAGIGCLYGLTRGRAVRNQ